MTRADLQALTMLDRLVEEDRRIEQKYDLPFRSPRQVATSFQPCAHCQKDIAWLIFGDFARDAASLEAYARMMDDAIKQNGLHTYVIAPPSDPRNLDGPSLLLKVYPEREEPGFTTPQEWEQLIARLSDAHCKEKNQQSLTTLAFPDSGDLATQKQDSVTRQKKTVEVKKTSSRARAPYAREVSTKVVTFTCSRCHTEVTMEKYPGPIIYCAACAALVKKEKTRARVATYRKRPSKKSSGLLPPLW